MGRRRKPYTKIGIRRLTCSRAGCNNRARTQWQICSDGNTWRPICLDCDVALNKLVLEWIGDPDARGKLERYAASLSEEDG